MFYDNSSLTIPLYTTDTATGSASGDPHFRTFDNRYYDLFSHCYHIYSKDCVDNTFAVYTHTTSRCSGGRAPTCIDQAIVEVPKYDAIIYLNRDLTVGYHGDPPPAGRVSVTVNAISIIVHIYELKVTVTYYPSSYNLAVTVLYTYANKLCGLLGNFDGNANNDFMLQDGTVSTLGAFEMDYRILPSTIGLTDEICEPRPPSPVPECTGDDKVTSEAFCEVLRDRSGAFAACHSTINPEQPFKDCVLDQCFGTDDNLGCAPIQDYADKCQGNGIMTGNPPDVCREFLVDC